MIKPNLKIILLVLISLSSQVSWSTAKDEVTAFKAGTHYKVIKQESRITPRNNDIEINSVFLYSCPHCQKLNGKIAAWKKTLPEDVNFVSTPAIFDYVTREHAKIYYISDSLGILDKAHSLTFEQVVGKRKYLIKESELFPFFEELGISDKDFNTLYASDNIASKVTKASDYTNKLQLMSVPTIIVDGKYQIITHSLKNFDDIFRLAEELYQKAKLERS